MANFKIINVELGDDIDKIVSSVLSEIIQKDDDEIAQAVEEAKQRTIKIQPLSDKEKSLETIYSLLLEKEETMSAPELMKLGKAHFTTISGLITALKTFIRKRKANEYIVIKEDWNGKLFYRLKPYNAIPITPTPVQ